MRVLSIAAALAAFLFAGEVVAASITLNTVKDHSGLVEDDDSSRQAQRDPDLLWGSVVSDAARERRGLVEFDALSASVLTDLANPATIVDSVTLKLTSAPAGWGETTLDFRPLLEAANADWAELGGGGSVGPSFNLKDNTGGAPVDWVGGAGLETNLTAPIFGSLTSTSSGGAGTVFNTSFSTGADVRAWLSSGAAPHLFVTSPDGSGNQTRFYSQEGANGASDITLAPQLTISYTIPEPGSVALAMLALAGFGAAGMRNRLV